MIQQDNVPELSLEEHCWANGNLTHSTQLQLDKTIASDQDLLNRLRKSQHTQEVSTDGNKVTMKLEYYYEVGNCSCVRLYYGECVEPRQHCNLDTDKRGFSIARMCDENRGSVYLHRQCQPILN